MYTLRLLIIIFLMTASNLYAQQREDDKANSVIMSSQANRLIERGEYEEALKLLQKAEKTYAANNDTLTASFIVVFLAPQFECYRMLKRYEEATYISYRIMMINRKKATRSEIQPNNRETRQRKTEAVKNAPIKAAEDEGDNYDIDYVLAVACALGAHLRCDGHRLPLVLHTQGPPQGQGADADTGTTAALQATALRL